MQVRYGTGAFEVLVWVGPAHYEVGQFLDFEQTKQTSAIVMG